MNDKLDQIIAFIEAEKYEENQSQNQSQHGYGRQDMGDVVSAEDLVAFIEQLKSKE